MQFQCVLVAVLAALASAAPIAKKYYGISLNVNVSPAGQTPVLEPAPIQINKLTSLHQAKASELRFDLGVHINVDINSVECRAYKDVAGTVPGSAPFTAKKPAYLSTNLGEVGSVLCYITEST